MRRMQAAGIDVFGGEVRVLKLAAPASPAPDEVVISVRAAGVGNWDEFVRVGNWDVGRRPPLALGVEAAGVVAAAGKDVTSLAPGDEVLTHPLPLRHQGAWAEWLVAPAALVARKPAAVPWAAAAAFPVPALTADQALTDAAPVPAGKWVLVHGAGGVTGGLAVQLAVARGATVVATAGPSSAARIRGDGAHAVFDYHDPEWPTLVRNATPGGRGVDAVVNAARGGAATALQTDGEPHQRRYSCSAVSGRPDRSSWSWMPWRNARRQRCSSAISRDCLLLKRRWPRASATRPRGQRGGARASIQSPRGDTQSSS